MTVFGRRVNEFVKNAAGVTETVKTTEARMGQRYIGNSFDTMGGDSTANASVSLVGSHLQNICVEVESDAADLSFIVSPVGARKLVAAIEAALAELKQPA